jgi:glyoxylase-like metal-dependent hydrolase (beta-lactamase superfamily II)
LRAVALHPDVIVVTSALLQVNCVIVRGGAQGEPGQAGATGSSAPDAGERAGETFVIDSPVLPDELDALPALIEQVGFPAPNGLLATHGDWDHLLGRLAFPGLALGCAESTAERLGGAPGEAQRELRGFDEELMIERPHPLALGSVQALPVPGRCELGEHELQLHATGGHTPDGMAVLAGWAGVLVAGDYLSQVELPTLGAGAGPDAYTATLEALGALLGRIEHVVPGHGPVLDRERAAATCEEDLAYLRALGSRGERAELPGARRNNANRARHAQNVAVLAGGG